MAKSMPGQPSSLFQKTHGIGIKDETGLVGKGRVEGVGEAQEDDERRPLDPGRRRHVLRVRGEGEEGEEDDEEELQLLAERSAHGCCFFGGVCCAVFERGEKWERVVLEVKMLSYRSNLLVATDGRRTKLKKREIEKDIDNTKRTTVARLT